MFSQIPIEASVPVQNELGNRIALKLNDQSNLPTSQQLNRAYEIGIELLEVSFPTQLQDSVFANFYLLLDTKQRFPLVYEIESQQESILNTIQSQYEYVPVRLQGNIAAIKIFNYPADYSEYFHSALQDIYSQLAQSIDKPFYYQSSFDRPPPAGSSVDFVSGRVTAQIGSTLTQQPSVLLFEPSDNITKSLRSLEQILNQSLSYSESIVIIPATWFFSRIESQPVFADMVSSYLDGNRFLFPMPKEEQANPPINFHVIFLLGIWVCFVIYYKYQPVYKAALPRYFFNHSFFVNDIMQHRIRNASSGIIILILHCLMTGFFFFMVGESLISETGFEALAHHFPAIIFPGFEKLCLFAIGVLAALFSHVISIGWLYLFNKELKQLNQVINLYSWPQHVNLGIITLFVYLHQVGVGNTWLIVVALTYILVWFLSFYIAAIDGARFLEKFRALNVLLTVGIHFILIVGAVTLILLLPFIFEPLEMAFLLP